MHPLIKTHPTLHLKYTFWDFPDGPVVKNLLRSVGNTGSIPGPGRAHMPEGNWGRAATTEPSGSEASMPQLESLCASAKTPRDQNRQKTFIICTLSLKRYWKAKQVQYTKLSVMTFIYLFHVRYLSKCYIISWKHFCVNFDLTRVLKKIFPFWGRFP